MKIRYSISLLLFLTFTSCDYNQNQKDIIQQITSSGDIKYESVFKNNLLTKFSKKEIIDLSSHENPEVALYFFNILVEKYPEECFKVLMKNLDNQKILNIHTSYDTIDEKTVPDAMMFYTISRKNIFTHQQKEQLFTAILKDFEHKHHLEGYLFSYLYENVNNPDPKFYPEIRKLIERKREDINLGDLALLNYMANYNQPKDSLLIKDFLYRGARQNKSYPIHMNISVEFIKKHPLPSYFPILEEFNNTIIKGKTFRADDSFFELEDLTIATLQYKTEKAKKLINTIAYDTSYEPNDLALNENLYFLLKKYDTTNYFSDITDKIEPQISTTKLNSVKAKHERWDQHAK
ncbi:hypothetical protein F3J23_05580 [Chryseobacterium sp. Tr-659]|uniref:hypothetical protein n=1 Tax=Chryseobacterium sp. Tr-659 TaxID=2608340 RepID=UPI00141E4CE1|nr:hypothetical protein [Chryseobacterium sp. Tr-659]NIF04906.1 hypothetical protein [Chryseobacterium sp. Tr-659]